MVSFVAMNLDPRLRTLLILGRVSNLPTVWSNALAGWWLGGGNNYWKLPLLLLGSEAEYAAAREFAPDLPLLGWAG